MLLLATVVLGILALSIAACRARRAGSKALILGTLFITLMLICTYVAAALGVLSAHETRETVAKWPTPSVIALIGLTYFTAISCLAFLRKQS